MVVRLSALYARGASPLRQIPGTHLSEAEINDLHNTLSFLMKNIKSHTNFTIYRFKYVCVCYAFKHFKFIFIQSYLKVTGPIVCVASVFL
jgi:hypothetical protein